MTANHLPAAIAGGGKGEDPTGQSASRFGFGLGWGVNTDVVASGVLGSVGEYSWGGAAGTVFWVDPVEEMVVVGMIQLMGFAVESTPRPEGGGGSGHCGVACISSAVMAGRRAFAFVTTA